MFRKANFQLIAFVSILTGAVALSSTGCELIASVDRNKIASAGGAGGAGSGGGGTGGTPSGGSGGTGGGAMCDPLQCPAGTDCQTPVCVNDACAFENDPAGTDCTVNNEAGTCDDAGMCVAFSCQNSTLDPGETDVDCGGPTCPNCDNGLDCATDEDCKSNNCNGSGAGGAGGSGGGAATGTCDPCTDGGCPTMTFCDVDAAMTADRICQPEKAQGMACDGHIGECATGNCVDGFCCDTACNGLCQACDVSGSEGTCGNAPPGTTDPGCTLDPSTCTADVCDGNGACDILASGQCSPASCTGSSFTPASTCDGTTPGCPSVSSMPCAMNFACDSGGTACLSQCSNNTHCATGFYCSGGACVAQKMQGDPCTNVVGECDTERCVDGFCCNNDCAGTCESCAAADTGGTNGTCAPVSSGIDPANDCGNDCCDGAGMCDTSGACTGP